MESLFDNITLEHDTIYTLNSINSSAKCLKIEYNDWILFENNEKISAEKFPFLFIFRLILSKDTPKDFNKLFEEKFNDKRPLLIIQQSKFEEKIYVREGKKIKEVSKISNDEAKTNLKRNVLNFSTFMAVLKMEDQKSFIQKFLNLVLSLESILMMRILNFLSLESNEKVKQYYSSKNRDLNFLKAFLDLPFDFDETLNVSSKSKELVELITSKPNNMSILRKMVEENEIKIVSFLIDHFKLCFDSWPLVHKLTLMEKAYELNYQEIYLPLIKADFPFSSNFIKTDDKIIQQRVNLHKAIKDGKIERVKEFVDQNPLLKVALDFDNNSALMKSLNLKELEIYSFLIAYDFQWGKHEDKRPSEDDFIEIDRHSIQYCEPNPKKFAIILTSKSFVHKSTETFFVTEERREKIQQLLFELNDIKIVSLLFKITADFVKRISFDFSSRSIRKMKPSKEKALGLCRPTDGVLLIGAGDSDDETKDTIVHELTHMAVQIVYQNDCKPFYKHDSKREIEFKEEVKKYDKDPDFDEISFVYEYHEDFRISELIVAIFTIHANYHDDSEKLNKFKESFEKLSIYFEKVKNDFENFNPDLRREVRDLNKEFGVISDLNLKFKNKQLNANLLKSRIIITKIPFMTISSVFQQLKNYFDSLVDIFCLFIDIKKLLTDTKIAEKYQKIIQECKDIKIICNLNHETMDIDQVLDKIFIHKNVQFNFIVQHDKFKICEWLQKNSIEYVEFSVDHKWNHLTTDSKQQVLKKKIMFQNKEISLSVIVNFKDSENLFDDNFLNYCLSEKVMEINKVESNNYFHIPRKLRKKYKICKTKIISKNDYEVLKKKKDQEIKLISVDNDTCKIEEFIVKEFDQKDFLDNCTGLKCVLISDVAGNGKTRSLLKTRDDLIINFPKFLVYYIDLKIFIPDFSTITEEINFSKFFREKIMESKRDYEKAVFHYFYEHSSIFILFDGFDEISQEQSLCKEHVVNLINSFEFKNESQLFITTRDHLEIYLKEKLKIEKIFSLCPISKPDQKEFVTSFWTDLKISGDLSAMADKLIDKLSTVMTTPHSDLIGLPQQLKIAAEIVTDSNKIDEEFLENFTMYTMYKKSIHKLHEKWLREGGPLAMKTNIEAEDSGFNVTHKLLAMKSHFKKDEFCGSTLHPIWVATEIKRCGVITNFDKNHPIFLHETYKEAFVAIFIVQNLDKSESWKYYKELFDYFIEFLCKDNFNIVRMFIDDGLKDLEFSERKLEVFSHILKDLILINPRVIQLVASESCENLLKFILKILSKLDNNFDLVKTIFDAKVTFSYIFRDDEGNILLKLARMENFSTLELLLEFSKKIFKPQDFDLLVLNQSEVNKFSFFHLGALLPFNSFERLVNILKEKSDHECFKKLLTLRSSDDKSPLFHLTMYSQKPTFELYWECLNQYLTDDERKELIFFSKQGLTIFYTSVLYENSESFKFLINKIKPEITFLQAIVAIREARFNCFFAIAYVRDKTFHKVFWRCIKELYTVAELRNSFFQTYEYGNMLHNLVTFGNKNSLNVAFVEMKNILGIEEFKTLFDTKGFGLRNILQKAVDRVECEADKVQFLLQFTKDLYKDNFKPLLYYPDGKNDNLLHICAFLCTAEVTSVVIKFIESLMPENEIKPYLKKVGYCKMNLLQHALRLNKSLETHKLLWSIYEKYFKNLNEFIIHPEKHGSNLFHIAVKFSSLNICKFTWEKIESILKIDEDRKNYLTSLGYEGRNLYVNSLGNDYTDVKEWVKSLLNSYDLKILS